MRPEKPVYASPRLSQVSPMFNCLWNISNVRLIDDGPLSSFQGRLSSASPFHTSLSGDRWYDVFGFVTAGSVLTSSKLLIFRDKSHLWWLLSPPVYLLANVLFSSFFLSSFFLFLFLCFFFFFCFVLFSFVFVECHQQIVASLWCQRFCT